MWSVCKHKYIQKKLHLLGLLCNYITMHGHISNLKVNMLLMYHINLLYDHTDVVILIFEQEKLMAININFINSRNRCTICDQNTVIHKVT
jgi:hypothetical protein